MHEVVAPELEGRILDELYEGNEETPGVWPVHDQPLQQNPERAGVSGSGVCRRVSYTILLHLYSPLQQSFQSKCFTSGVNKTRHENK